jgi:hypothetical protein
MQEATCFKSQQEELLMNDKQREEYVRNDKTLRSVWQAEKCGMRTFLRSKRSLIDQHIEADLQHQFDEPSHEQTSGN